MAKMRNTVTATALALAVVAGSIGSFSVQAQGQGGGNTANNTTFQEWLNDRSAKNVKMEGRVTRQEYMREAGRRWDMMDKRKRGLTMEEIGMMNGPAAVMGGPTATSTQAKKGITQ